MKSLFTYPLLISITFNVFLLEQLLKIPVLFEHFQEHQQRETDISFLNFLTHHYSFEKHTDKDESRDMQLPFKSHTSHAGGFDFHAATRFTYLPKAAELSGGYSFSYYYLLHIPTPYQQSQFRPPRA
ncbi:hypothetical protein [Parapedobacter koreensis]|uniref:Uncharacterized protein n=1 Tax=Parapedobacter koreensis TaxID=332977 RepID=A0A1H7F0L7_9SPHI|nr:hypothetical protein [Parapedobacter koreensis]SEK19641.1 hypothetical protein SAMN05421740_101168 [Parapedobacter koreensis]